MVTFEYRKGFTLVEILVVTVIIGIIAVVSAVSFKNMYSASSLRAGGEEVYRALSSARTNTLASQSDLVYGVFLATSTVTRFVGATYNAASTTNVVYTFTGGVTATSSLIANGTSIVFRRLTGAASASGTIYIRNSDGTSTTTLRIYSSGLVEYQ